MSDVFHDDYMIDEEEILTESTLNKKKIINPLTDNEASEIDSDMDGLSNLKQPIPIELEFEIETVISPEDIETEMDVFISKELCDFLYLLQYPTRSIPLTSFGTAITTSMKPISKQLQFSVALDIDGPNYNSEQGELMGTAQDTNPLITVFDQDLDREEKLHDYQIYTSSFQPTKSDYMIGTFVQSTHQSFYSISH